MNYFKIAKFFLILPVLGIAIVTPSTLFPFIVGKYVWFRISIALASIFFLLGTILNPKEYAHLNVGKRLKNPLVIAIALFIGFFLLACLFAANPSLAFWSTFERGEGGLQLIFLFLFFSLLVVLFQEERDWRRIFGWSIFGAVLMVLYGIGSLLKYVDAAQNGPFSQIFGGFIGSSMSDPGFRFGGSIGNPAYVATYLVFIFFFMAYLLVTKYRNRLLSLPAIGYYLLGAFLMVFFVLAATRGAFIGLVAALVFFLAYIAYSKKRWRKALLGVAFGILILLGVLVAFKNVPILQNIPGYANFSRLLDLSFATKTFQDRTTIWKMAWDGFRARPILGWGPENFITVFDTHFNPDYFNPSEGFGAWFDRAHSVFLDYLVETGIFGFLSFLGIFITFYWQFAKKWIFSRGLFRSQRTEERAQQSRSLVLEGMMFVLPLAYLIQGLVLFDVLPIYISLYLFLAFAVYEFERPHPSL